MGRVDGKAALISGAGNGQGKAEAKLLAQEGAKVAIGDIRDDDGKAVAEEINRSGGEAVFVHLNVTDEDSWIQVIDAVVGAFGKLNVLVNNAGLSGSSQPDLMGTEGWHRIMAVNATGPFLGIKHAIPRMLESGGGSIVNISSTSGLVGSSSPRHPAYNTSKGGVRLLTKGIAAAYATQGIRCNSVHPGIMPPMTTATDTNRDPSTGVFDIVPMRRAGRVEEIAYAVLFLASDEASYITGAELVVDGGMTCV